MGRKKFNSPQPSMAKDRITPDTPSDSPPIPIEPPTLDGADLQRDINSDDNAQAAALNPTGSEALLFILDHRSTYTNRKCQVVDTIEELLLMSEVEYEHIYSFLNLTPQETLTLLWLWQEKLLSQRLKNWFPQVNLTQIRFILQEYLFREFLKVQITKRG